MDTIDKVRGRNELADFLKVPRKKLSYILYIKGVDNLYTSFDIPKRREVLDIYMRLRRT